MEDYWSVDCHLLSSYTLEQNMAYHVCLPTFALNSHLTSHDLFLSSQELLFLVLMDQEGLLHKCFQTLTRLCLKWGMQQVFFFFVTYSKMESKMESKIVLRRKEREIFHSLRRLHSRSCAIELFTEPRNRTVDQRQLIPSTRTNCKYFTY